MTGDENPLLQAFVRRTVPLCIVSLPLQELGTSVGTATSLLRIQLQLDDVLIEDEDKTVSLEYPTGTSEDGVDADGTLMLHFLLGQGPWVFLLSLATVARGCSKVPGLFFWKNVFQKMYAICAKKILSLISMRDPRQKKKCMRLTPTMKSSTRLTLFSARDLRFPLPGRSQTLAPWVRPCVGGPVSPEVGLGQKPFPLPKGGVGGPEHGCSHQVLRRGPRRASEGLRVRPHAKPPLLVPERQNA